MAYRCCICHEAIKENEASALPCGHIFDSECITTWIKKDATCPICRQRTFRTDIIRLFNQDEVDQTEMLLQEQKEQMNNNHKEEIAKLRDQLKSVELQNKELTEKYQKHLSDHINTGKNYDMLVEKYDKQADILMAQQRDVLLNSSNLLRYQNRRYENLKQKYNRLRYKYCISETQKKLDINRTTFVHSHSSFIKSREKVENETKNEKKTNFDKVNQILGNCTKAIDECLINLEKAEHLLSTRGKSLRGVCADQSSRETSDSAMEVLYKLSMKHS